MIAAVPNATSSGASASSASRSPSSSTAASTRPLPAPTVEVCFAAHADDDIAALARPGVRVVTSDRGLAERVRAAGGEVEPSKAFRDRLG